MSNWDINTIWILQHLTLDFVYEAKMASIDSHKSNQSKTIQKKDTKKN